MAKKNLNPADSFRKAERKKQLKKNKADRSKARDFALVKKDTGDLEDEIEKLEAAKDPTEQSRLAELKAELEKINRKKAEYVEEHPEQRRLVYRPRRREGDAPAEEIVLPKRKMFDKKGLPLHPERSVYYDPVMNPFGVAPPGMPYMERPPLPGEVWSDDESDEDDDGIAMPAGRPPGEHDEDYDVDDIQMPEGPPPGQTPEDVTKASTSSPPLPPPVLPSPGLPPPPQPPGVPPHIPQGLPPFPPTFPPGFTGASFPPPPPPPPGFPVGNFPPPLPTMHTYSPLGFPSHPTPPPPPGFFPRRNQSASSMQDPLSSLPHQTFQAHPTVFAAPQLRDFKKEATAFVPTSIKRKRPGAPASSSQVNAAPGTEEDDNQQSVGPARPDLLSALKDQFGPVPSAAPPNAQKRRVEKKKDDYDKFMEEIGDIL
ncbi:WW domain binding protein 11-domain-containing protein [Lyophyllum atratum]|nr:WW domain binding protein 11-domain-containing protein [Lyophyllum atratum]